MKKILIIIMCMFLCGCGYDEYDMPDDVVLITNENKYKIFTNLNIKDLIKESNVELINKDEHVTNNLIGDHIATVEYNYKGRKYKYDVTYHMYDDEEPLIMNYSSTLTTLKNEDIYPCNNINYIDNYDREPECIIDGEYDTTKIGTYKVKYVIKDSSNNETTRNLTIKVLKEYPKKDDKKPTKQPEVKKDEIADMIAKYKNDDNEIGIDVSRWQGDIDFNQVKDAGISFVIMRIGVHNGPSEVLDMDTKFEQNIKNAKDAGLKVGVYVYTTAVNEVMASDHAKWVIKSLNGTKLDFPIAFDWENWNHIKEYNVSIHDMHNVYKTFENEIKRNGYESMLYSSKYYLETIWGSEFNKVWLAHYTEQTSYEGPYQLWQFSNIGKVPGINADVDLDIYYKK